MSSPNQTRNDQKRSEFTQFGDGPGFRCLITLEAGLERGVISLSGPLAKWLLLSPRCPLLPPAPSTS